MIAEVCGLNALTGEVVGNSHSFIVSEHEASNGLDMDNDYQFPKHMRIQEPGVH